MDAAEREPELAELHADLHAHLMAPFAAVTDRARVRDTLDQVRVRRDHPDRPGPAVRP